MFFSRVIIILWKLVYFSKIIIKLYFDPLFFTPSHFFVTLNLSISSMSSPHSILQAHHLRITDCRVAIIREFLDKSIALSHSDLEDTLNKEFDRVTIYRTLKTFLEKDLIHKVLDDSGATKYAFCTHGEEAHAHNHEHVHFKCEKCEETICLEDISLPAIPLPKGFVKKEMNLLVQGICEKCH